MSTSTKDTAPIDSQKRIADFRWSMDFSASASAQKSIYSAVFGTARTKLQWSAKKYHQRRSNLPKYKFTLWLVSSTDQETIRFDLSFQRFYAQRHRSNSESGELGPGKKYRIFFYEKMSDQPLRLVFGSITLYEVDTLTRARRHQVTCAADMRRLYSAQEPPHADVTLVTTADGREFTVHRNILSTRSTVFAAMFAHSEMVESVNKRVLIEDISGEAMDALLKYIYGGDLTQIDAPICAELFVAADKYNIPLLASECLHRMVSRLSVENAAYLFYLADLYPVAFDKATILKLAQFMATNRQAVSESAAFVEYIKPNSKLLHLFSVAFD